MNSWRLIKKSSMARLNDLAIFGKEALAKKVGFMRIFFIGDIVGQQGIKKLSKQLPQLKNELKFDFCIANAENVADGLGITSQQARTLLALDIDCITLGNHCFSKLDILKIINEEKRIIRPANGNSKWPGFGYGVFNCKNQNILVISLLGQAFMNTPLSPFAFMEENIMRLRTEHKAKIVILDFHAEASSEKLAMAYYLIGKVSAVIGTHTHIQTADERILDQKLAYITDVGMTGPWNSVIGLDVNVSLRRFVDCMPSKYQLADSSYCLSAVLIDIDNVSGHAVQIARYFERPNLKGEIKWVKS